MNKYHLFLRGPFSNFVTADIIYRGHYFNTTEQAFMYAKAVDFNDTEIAEALLDTTLKPWDAKKLGRQVKNFNTDVWSKICYQRMLEVNRLKFGKQDKLTEFLLNTGDDIIVECNPKDTIWGIGLSEDDPNALDESKWKGQNLLGKVLMQIRQELREVTNHEIKKLS